MVPNQIHDVGKLIREAVAEGWEYAWMAGQPMLFGRGDQIVTLRAVVRSYAELAEHRRALGLPELKSAEAKK